MKDEKKKTIQELATELMKIEKECQLGHNLSENISKMEQLIHNLSLEEMLEIDAYIQNYFLTK